MMILIGGSSVVKLGLGWAAAQGSTNKAGLLISLGSLGGGVFRRGAFRIARHQSVYIRDAADVLRNVRLIRAKHRVTLRRFRMVAMHAANGPFAHMAGHDEHAFVREKN